MSGKDLCNWLATIAAIVMGAGVIAAMVQQHDERIANEAKMEQRVEALEWAVWSHSMASKFPTSEVSRGLSATRPQPWESEMFLAIMGLAVLATFTGYHWHGMRCVFPAGRSSRFPCGVVPRWCRDYLAD